MRGKIEEILMRKLDAPVVKEKAAQAEEDVEIQ